MSCFGSQNGGKEIKLRAFFKIMQMRLVFMKGMLAVLAVYRWDSAIKRNSRNAVSKPAVCKSFVKNHRIRCQKSVRGKQRCAVGAKS